MIAMKPANGYAQYEEEFGKLNIELLKENREDWVPALLSAGQTPVNNLAQYNGFIFNWVPRGQKFNRENNMDGINWQSNASGWNPSFTYAALYKTFHTQGGSVNNEFSDITFSNKGSSVNMSSSTLILKKSLIIGSRFSNGSFINENYIQYQSGKTNNGWHYNINTVWQQAPLGSIVVGFKNITGFSLSADKQFRKQQVFGFVFWWDKAVQGKISPSVREPYVLLNERNYNPNWGWYNGQIFYPNTKKTNVPVISLRYQKKWKENLNFNFNIGMASGKQSNAQLDWTKTIDPRPDYYKYLPSFSKDDLVKKQLISWFQDHPQALQINFDKLVAINQANATRRSFYIINNKLTEVNLLKSSFLFHVKLNENWNSDMGFSIANDQLSHTNQIDNLLGGAYFLNYNGWVDDNGLANNFQNDLINPDQKISVGQKWGSNYRINSIDQNAWGQIKKIASIYEINAGILLGNTKFRRVGYNQNGLFPNNSLGQSMWLNFPYQGFKFQLLNKFSGRLYLKTIFYFQSESPNSSSVFLDPALSPALASFILPKQDRGASLSLFYRGVKAKLSLSGFYSAVRNEFDKNLFYHDAYFAFVYGMVGQIKSIYKGIEFNIETELPGFIQLSAASSFGKYYIVNNPLYEIILSNDLFKIETGTLNLKNLPASTSPPIVQALSINFQPNYSFRLGLTGVYSMRRSIDYNYFKRSSFLKNQITDELLWNQMCAPNYLSDQLVVNGFLSQNFILKRKSKNYQCRLNMSVRNLFNTLIPILVFEQSRFDYVGKNIQKFPLKYLYDQGLTYSIGIQFQAQ